MRFEDDRYDPVHDGLNPAEVLDPVEFCEYRLERAARERTRRLRAERRAQAWQAAAGVRSEDDDW